MLQRRQENIADRLGTYAAFYLNPISILGNYEIIDTKLFYKICKGLNYFASYRRNCDRATPDKNIDITYSSNFCTNVF